MIFCGQIYEQVREGRHAFCEVELFNSERGLEFELSFDMGDGLI